MDDFGELVYEWKHEGQLQTEQSKPRGQRMESEQ